MITYFFQGKEEDSDEMIGTPLPSEDVLDQKSLKQTIKCPVRPTLFSISERFADVPLSQASFEFELVCDICGKKKDKRHYCHNWLSLYAVLPHQEYQRSSKFNEMKCFKTSSKLNEVSSNCSDQEICFTSSKLNETSSKCFKTSSKFIKVSSSCSDQMIYYSKLYETSPKFNVSSNCYAQQICLTTSTKLNVRSSDCFNTSLNHIGVSFICSDKKISPAGLNMASDPFAIALLFIAFCSFVYGFIKRYNRR